MTTTLIVDDEIDMRMLVRVVIELADSGLEVVGEAEDGEDAIAQFRALDGPPDPDVIILDNRMPRLSGLEAARQILAERPDQRIILYSAYLNEAVCEEAAAVGIVECVSKTDMDSLPETIRRVASSNR